MALRSVISAVVFLLVFANFSKADLNVYPERCDNEEICEYLSDFGIPEFITDNQCLDWDLWEASSDLIVKDKTHILSQKLIAILYLCKIAGDYTQPDDDLGQAILSKLKIFQCRGCRELLPTESLKE